MPPDLAEIAHRAAVSVYAAIQKAADGRIEIIEHDAALRINRSERTRLEAELEIENLERQVSALMEQLDQARAPLRDASERAERAEAQAANSSEVGLVCDEPAQTRTLAGQTQSEEARLPDELVCSQVNARTCPRKSPARSSKMAVPAPAEPPSVNSPRSPSPDHCQRATSLPVSK